LPQKLKTAKILELKAYTELSKRDFQKLLICFEDLINIFWRYENVAKEWIIAIIATIYKNGDTPTKWRHTYKNYRGVSLINCGYKRSAKTVT
jgi:hypothetical protein